MNRRPGRATSPVALLRLQQQNHSLMADLRALREENLRLHRESRTDAGTGLANRRALSEVARVRVGVDGSNWSTCSTIFIDLDHFSDFNHRYGDAAGDEALVAVAGALRDAARREDLVFRKGGEEFVVILPEASANEALGVARRISAAIRALDIAHAGSPSGRLTALLTVTEVEATAAIDDAVTRAGNAAMQSKACGLRAAVVHARNRCECDRGVA
jgi:diguanylate cyclase (GGDEF)-like protein